VHSTTVPAATNSSWSRWSLRPRLDLRPAAELGLMVRIVSSSVRIRLEWAGSARQETKDLVKNRLAALGWTLDPYKGAGLKAQLFESAKGEVAGFSETLKRREVKLVLTRGAARIEATGLGTGSTDAKAVENAINKISFSPQALGDLLSGK
jgi:hypothetical protein